MTPTPKSLEAMYIMLCQLKPICRWNLPDTSKIKFIVTNDEEAYGTYTYDPETELHEITISRAKCAFMETVLKTLCHELVHMKIAGPQGMGENWDKHNYKFKTYTKAIADEFGFDPLEL